MIDVLAWLPIGLIGAVCGGAIWIVVVMNTARLETKYGRISSGGAVFDEAFHPSGAEAQRLQEREKRTIVPAPSPEAGPDAIDFAGGRVTLTVDEPRVC